MKNHTKTNMARAFAGAAVIASVLLAGCEFPGSSTPAPSIEQVKAWRMKNGTQMAHKITSYEVSDLSCAKAPKEEIERIKAGYKALGSNADEAISSYATCSYTINAEFEGVTVGFVTGKSYKVTGFRMTDEMWLLGALKGKDPEWQGKQGAPDALRAPR
ncbi:hypothetical protein [Hydrogenophaga sp. BPS33]|uniref:hypothetical protein n=1 Tax=Hydrogenophaga sp. BPS33 TaxID=2651974 RepID=UPI00131FA816|nr:hypothetical protein [Hydrogenophaga sp. BPS33]QHE89380.1 hypothetical protein F9K07_30880 [Hydrogenophaga sp. BPS33]